MRTAWKVTTVILYKLMWLACVVGAGRGHPWLGVWAAIPMLGVALYASEDRTNETKLILWSALIGYAGDSAFVLAGFIKFPAYAQLIGPSALWMVALWAGFGATFNATFGWLRDRLWIVAISGAIGGPMAYWAGEGLRALEFPMGHTPAFIAVGIEWLIAMPLLLWLGKPAGGAKGAAVPAAAEVSV